jgi:hypothetical protein
VNIGLEMKWQEAAVAKFDFMLWGGGGQKKQTFLFRGARLCSDVSNRNVPKNEAESRPNDCVFRIEFMSPYREI